MYEERGCPWLDHRFVFTGKHDPGCAGWLWVGEDLHSHSKSYFVPTAVDDFITNRRSGKYNSWIYS